MSAQSSQRTDTLISNEQVANLFTLIADRCVRKLTHVLPVTFWTQKRLAAFYLGVPSDISRCSMDTQLEKHRAYKQYHLDIRELSISFDDEYIQKAFGYFIDGYSVEAVLSRFTKSERVFVASAFFDMTHELVFSHVFSRQYERVFAYLFPTLYKRAEQVQATQIDRLRGIVGIQKLVKGVEHSLRLLNPNILAVLPRLRMPAGVYKESIRKSQTMYRIDDFLSLNIIYDNSVSVQTVTGSVSTFLDGYVQHYTYEKKTRGMYVGYHYYFLWNGVPIEVKVRDGEGEVSALQKRQYTDREKAKLR